MIDAIYRVSTNTGKLFDVWIYGELAIECEDVELYINIVNAKIDELLPVFTDPNETSALYFYSVENGDMEYIETIYGYTILKQYKTKGGLGPYLRLAKPEA